MKTRESSVFGLLFYDLKRHHIDYNLFRKYALSRQQSLKASMDLIRLNSLAPYDAFPAPTKYWLDAVRGRVKEGHC